MSPLELARPHRLIAAALSLSLVSGCGSITGLSGGSEYGCKAPPGVKCDSVSGTYYNALQNNLPSQRSRHTPPADGAASSARDAGPRAITTDASQVPAPLRSEGRVLRLWVKPWEDADRDLHDQGYVYVQVEPGRWLVEHVQQRIRDAYAPVRAPWRSGPSAANPSPPAASAGDASAPVQALKTLQDKADAPARDE